MRVLAASAGSAGRWSPPAVPALAPRCQRQSDSPPTEFACLAFHRRARSPARAARAAAGAPRPRASSAASSSDLQRLPIGARGGQRTMPGHQLGIMHHFGDVSVRLAASRRRGGGINSTRQDGVRETHSVVLDLNDAAVLGFGESLDDVPGIGACGACHSSTVGVSRHAAVNRVGEPPW